MVHLSTTSPCSQHILPVKKPSPSLKETIASPVMSVKAWRAQQKMEKNAGFTEDKSTLTSELSCDGCRIFIGRDHEEQELYFLPLLRQYAKLKHGYRFYEHAVFHVCGDCARRKGIPSSMMFFGHSVWQTRRIIFKAEVIAAETLLYGQVMGLWKASEEMPSWSWWSQWIPPLSYHVQSAPVNTHQPVPQAHTEMQSAIHDVNSLLQALSVIHIPVVQQQVAS